MPDQHRRLRRERKTIQAMIQIYCQGHRHSAVALCGECQLLADYAMQRIERCPFGADKPTCARCPVHCYKPEMRERVRRVMRYAGPRMLVYHPLLTFLHTWDQATKRGKPVTRRTG